MQEGETQPTTKKTVVVNIFKVIIIGILVVLASRVPFLHKQYEFVDSEYSVEFRTHKDKYKQIVKNRDFELNKLVKDLEIEKITATQFTKQYQEVKENSRQNLKEYTKKKKQLLAKYKYKGFNAYYFFLFAIGTPIMALVLSFLFFYILMNPVTSMLKKFVFSIFGSLFLFTSSYFVLHAMFAEQVYNGDFPEDWYLTIIRYVPILISFTIPLLFYHYQTIEQNLKKAINNLIVFIAQSDKYIETDEKKKQHLEDSFEVFDEITK